MPRTTEFHEGDVSTLASMASELVSAPGRWQRITGARRWLVAEPAQGSGDVIIHVTPGADEGLELIVHPMRAAPGTPLMPKLGERGLRTPRGWQLTGDVGWVISWLAPSDTPVGDLLEFAFRVTKAVGSAPDDGRWRARLHSSDPRPGQSTAKI